MDLEIPHLDSAMARKGLVKALKTFRKLRKISRKRAETLFGRVVEHKKTATIVVGQSLDSEEEKYLLGLYKKTFQDTSRPTFSVNPHILGGVRMMWGDEMVELSLNELMVKN